MNADKLFDARVKELGDWRGDLISKLRQVIESADPGLTLEWKWGTSVWTKDGLVCATSAFKDHVKMNFFKGAALTDPHKLLNSGLTSKDHRAIDFAEGDKINEGGIRELVKEAIALNQK